MSEPEEERDEREDRDEDLGRFLLEGREGER